jgi:hypothetical protein
MLVSRTKVFRKMPYERIGARFTPALRRTGQNRLFIRKNKLVNDLPKNIILINRVSHDPRSTMRGIFVPTFFLSA